MQPLDIMNLKSLEITEKNNVCIFRMANDAGWVTMSNAAVLLKKALKIVPEDLLTTGFKACGLYPFDANASITRNFD